ncbi:MAG: hypothetical protein ACRCUE_04140 [Bosea sp. (in: a-proteobacteria)]
MFVSRSPSCGGNKEPLSELHADWRTILHRFGLQGPDQGTGDLCGKQVGASRSTTWPRQIGEWSDSNCVAKGKPAIGVVGTEGSVDARNQLKTERLQGGVQGSETMAYFQQLEPNTYIPLGQPFTVSLVGIPFTKTPEGTQLRDAVKGAIERLQQKGVYAQLTAKYGLQPNALTPITINQGK